MRFGVMCSGYVFRQWQSEAIARLLADGHRCSLVIRDRRQERRAGGEDGRRAAAGRIFSRNALWKAYLRSTANALKATRPVDLTSLLQDVPVIGCVPVRDGKYAERFDENDIATIRAHDLDFILRFGFGIIKGGILEAARYGVWSFHHDDAEKYRGGPPCFWEIYRGDPVTGAMLQRLTARLDAGVVLKKGYLKTLPSYPENLDQAYLECCGWPAQACRDILNGAGTGPVFNDPSATSAPVLHEPTNSQVLMFLAKAGLERLRRRWTDVGLVDHWNVGVVEGPVGDYLEAGHRPRVHWWPPVSRSRFAADPFGVVEDGVLHIFYEQYVYRERKGTIAHMCFQDGEFSPARVVLEEPWHLSYPFLLRQGRDVFMVPESHQANRVVLYRAVAFPLEWAVERVLLNGYAGLDTTIIFFNGSWWMFSCDKNSGPWHRLNLFFADELSGPWTPHPQNPVKTDVRSARPAGTPFVVDGALYRPAMDYSRKNQERISLNRVVTLTRTHYAEVLHGQVHPYRDSVFSDKTHTLSGVGGYTLVDGCKEANVCTDRHWLASLAYGTMRKLAGNWSLAGEAPK